MFERKAENMSVLELASVLASRLRHASLTLDDLQSLIALLTSTLATAKSYYNTSTPVNQLPNEILCSIFLFLSRDDQHHDEQWIVPSRKRSRDRIAQVCRHWRDVAVSYSVLWSNIGVRNERDCEMARCLLQRSRQAPLSLTVKMRDRTLANEVKNTLRDHISRIQDLHISGATWKPKEPSWHDFQEIYFPDYSFTFSKLVNLSVFMENPNIRRSDAHVAPPLLRGHVPNLKRLSVQTNSWLIGNQSRYLTHLCLSHCHNIPQSALWAVLSSNPSLEELILSASSGIKNELLESMDGPLARFAHMRRLALGGLTQHTLIKWLFRRFEFGPATNVIMGHRSLITVLRKISIVDRPRGFMHGINVIALDRGPNPSTIGLNTELGHGFLVQRFDVPTFPPMVEILHLCVSVQELWLSNSPYSFGWTQLGTIVCSLPALEKLVMCETHILAICKGLEDSKTVFPLSKLKAIHIFIDKPQTRLIINSLRDFAVIFTKHLAHRLEIELGFPTADMMEQYNEAGAILDHEPLTYKLSLLAEMPSLRVPQSNKMDAHPLWQKWEASFSHRYTN